MDQRKLLAELVKACGLLKQVQEQMPVNSRFSGKVQDVEHILNRTIVDMKMSKCFIDRKKLLEITQLLRLVYSLLSWFKDLFIYCNYFALRCLNEFRSIEATNW